MPFAQIYLIEGRSEEHKRALIEGITDAIVEAVGALKARDSSQGAPDQKSARRSDEAALPIGQRVHHRVVVNLAAHHLDPKICLVH